VADRSYPLSRPCTPSSNIDNERATRRVDPKLRELLRYGAQQAGSGGRGARGPATAADRALQPSNEENRLDRDAGRTGVIQQASTIKVRMSIDEDPIVVRLAEASATSGRRDELERVDLEKIPGEDYLMQEPLRRPDRCGYCCSTTPSTARGTDSAAGGDSFSTTRRA